MFQEMFRCDVMIDFVEIFVHMFLPSIDYADLCNLIFVICGICGSISHNLQNVFDPANGDHDPARTII